MQLLDKCRNSAIVSRETITEPNCYLYDDKQKRSLSFWCCAACSNNRSRVVFCVWVNVEKQNVSRETIIMIRTYGFVLPLPNGMLTPNRKKGRHWAVTADAIAENRYAARIEMLKILNGNPSPFKDATNCRYEIRVLFGFPDNKRRDLDNYSAALKPTFDGICDALEIDDSLIFKASQQKVVCPSNPRMGIVINQYPIEPETFDECWRLMQRCFT